MVISVDEVKLLIKRRDDMEVSLRCLLEVLKENKTNMTDALIDKDGFPRNDIDLYAVRKARHDINCLRNDLRDLTDQIEKSMIELHASSRNTAEPDARMQVSDGPNTSADPHRTTNDVFLRIADVSPGSPASQSGLLDGDRIIQFGSAYADNFVDMQQIADIVRNSENNSVRLTLLRDSLPVHLVLQPKKWSGTGLLGCRVVPVKRKMQP